MRHGENNRHANQRAVSACGKPEEEASILFRKGRSDSLKANYKAGRSIRHQEVEKQKAGRRKARLVRTHTRAPADETALVGAYRWFAHVVDAPDIHCRQAPRSKAGLAKYLEDELGKWAYGGLCTVIPPRTDGARALLMITVPDLVFARIDRIKPSKLLTQLDSIVLDRWRETAKLLSMDARCKLDLTIPAAAAIVKWRIMAEAPYHCTPDTFANSEKH